MSKRSLAASILIVALGIFSLGAMRLTSSISGTVNAASVPGSPPTVDDVNVHALQGNTVMGSDRTDASGHYEITDIEAGTYTLEFAKAHFVKTLVNNVTLGDGENKVVHAKIIASLQLSSATGAAAGSSRWRIRNQHSFPVNYEWRIAGTNIFGNGIALPGDSTFDTPALQSGQTLLLLVNNVVVRKKGGNGKEIAPDAGTLFGTVRDQTNVVLNQVAVHVIDSGNQLVASVLTGPDGTYQVDNLPADTYSVQFSKQSYSPVTSTGVVVAAGSVTAQNANLTQLAEVQVTVDIASGGVAVGATVTITYTDGSSATSITDSSGLAIFSDQPVGMAATILVVSADGSSTATVTASGGFSSGVNALPVTL